MNQFVNVPDPKQGNRFHCTGFDGKQKKDQARPYQSRPWRDQKSILHMED
jgi:hypothetical protein